MASALNLRSCACSLTSIVESRYFASQAHLCPKPEDEARSDPKTTQQEKAASQHAHRFFHFLVDRRYASESENDVDPRYPEAETDSQQETGEIVPQRLDSFFRALPFLLPQLRS